MSLPLPHRVDDERVQQNFEKISMEWPEASSNWTSYTPAITNSTFSLGNGTITGRYQKRGRTVIAYGNLEFGSTTSLSGTVSRVSLPFTAASTTYQYGLAKAFDASVNWAFGFFEVASGATYGIPRLVAGGGSTWVTVDATAPWTWAAGDSLSWSITYEAAS